VTAGRSWVQLLLVALALALGLGPAEAQAGKWYDDYAEALDALAAGRCEETVRLMRERLLPDMPEPVRRKRTYGMNYVEYLPYYHLGRALVCLRRYDDAVVAFETSERHGVVLKSKQAAPFRDALRSARAAAAPPATPTPATLSATPSPTPRIEVPTPRPQPTPTPRDARFDALVEGAHDDLEARRCQAALDRFDEARRRDPDAFQTAGLETERTAAARCVEAAARAARRQRVPEAQRPTPTPPTPQLTSPQSTGRSNRPAPPPALVSALRDLFSGRLEPARAALETLIGVDHAFRPEATAYLGVAYAALGYETTDHARTERLLAQAGANFRKAAALKPTIVLSERLVSPRIQALFDSSRAAVEP